MAIFVCLSLSAACPKTYRRASTDFPNSNVHGVEVALGGAFTKTFIGNALTHSSLRQGEKTEHAADTAKKNTRK